MTLKLSPEVLKSLAEPDSQGIVRATVALRVGMDGSADVVELNDMAVGGEMEPEADPEEAVEEEAPMPSPDEMEASLYDQA